MKLIINHWNFLGVPYIFLEKPHPKTEKKMVVFCSVFARSPCGWKPRVCIRGPNRLKIKSSWSKIPTMLISGVNFLIWQENDHGSMLKDHQVDALSPKMTRRSFLANLKAYESLTNYVVFGRI